MPAKKDGPRSPKAEEVPKKSCVVPDVVTLQEATYASNWVWTQEYGFPYPEHGFENNLKIWSGKRQRTNMKPKMKQTWKIKIIDFNYVRCAYQWTSRLQRPADCDKRTFMQVKINEDTREHNFVSCGAATAALMKPPEERKGYCTD
ncbi:hypothetical protein K1T71_009826 [Dendrolimus kikuchii]|uniref:Uncharacterized protein n=1 Tax=Dendrolimus kikuchii TaxID=765133 RepID=A0ACC1CT36_9NEOP|nr:hypothetical protein K1T71_009826 [Dendrolimus kikuchii]